MKERTKKLYSNFALQHKLDLQSIKVWAEEEKTNYSAYELTDSAYALREIIKFTEDTLKELKKQEKMSWAKCGIICITADVSGPIDTPYCVGQLKVEEIPDIPKRHKDPERYDEFMKFMGIPPELYLNDMIRLHWPNFMEWYNQRLRDAKPSPKGLDPSKTTTTAKLSIRKKREIEFIKEE